MRHWKTILKSFDEPQRLEEGGFVISKKYDRDKATELIKEAYAEWHGMDDNEYPDINSNSLSVGYVHKPDREEKEYYPDWEWVVESNKNRDGTGEDAVWVLWG